jgi:hypothetical protein
MPCPSHPPWLDHSNYIWRRIQVMKRVIITSVRLKFLIFVNINYLLKFWFFFSKIRKEREFGLPHPPLGASSASSTALLSPPFWLHIDGKGYNDSLCHCKNEPRLRTTSLGSLETVWILNGVKACDSRTENRWSRRQSRWLMGRNQSLGSWGTPLTPILVTTSPGCRRNRHTW